MKDNLMSEFPKQIIIETTAFCTQRCTHCAHKTLQRKKGNMDIVLYKKIIDEIATEAPNTEVWMTYYGEALILKYKLYYMIQYAKRKGLTNIVLNSNAMLLDQEMAEMIIESGLDRFIISMDTSGWYLNEEKIKPRGPRTPQLSCQASDRPELALLTGKLLKIRMSCASSCQFTILM